MQFNYGKLLGRIKEYGYTQETLAQAVDMNPWTLNQRLCNHSEFKQGEMWRICHVLDIYNPKDFFFCLMS